jgi:hypothetical protein
VTRSLGLASREGISCRADQQMEAGRAAATSPPGRTKAIQGDESSNQIAAETSAQTRPIGKTLR